MAMIVPSGNWDWDRLYACVPTAKVLEIVTISAPRAALGSDTPGWRWEMIRSFMTKSVYHVIVSCLMPTNESVWNFIAHILRDDITIATLRFTGNLTTGLADARALVLHNANKEGWWGSECG
ncbi:hypothetical protein V6N12_035507 [Hibiscus sabdariffa]|uniref:Uncharacterized protein n=1 Tax=Hibiscus sabdariffa TaxID=183260 RepID=A0ABR2EPQ1_9ROSI